MSTLGLILKELKLYVITGFQYRFVSGPKLFSYTLGQVLFT